MPDSSRARTSSGAREPRTEHLASSATSASVIAWSLARHVVLVHQSRAEQQRVIGTESDRHTCVPQRPQRHVCRLGVDAEPHVGRRADLQRGLSLGQPADQVGLLDSPHAVADPVGPELVQAGGDALRAGQLAPVRHRQEPGPRRDPERRREVLRPTRAARRWTGRTRRRPRRRSARPAGPACARPADGGSGWPRSPPRCPRRSRRRPRRAASRMSSIVGVSPPSRVA